MPDPQRILDFFHQDFQAYYELAKTRPAPPAEPSSMASLLAALERAILTVDQVIAQRQVPVCQGITRSGKPCRNHPLAGEKFCRVHLPKAVEVVD